MLTGSRMSFNVPQIVPDVQDRLLGSSGANVCGLQTLPGECVLQKAVLVRKKLSCSEGGGWLSGTLFCTRFRVAFVPQDEQKCDEDLDPVLLQDHDVALASIERVLAIGLSRSKLVTPTSSLKFTPEELVLYCRDFRVICFLFDRLTPEEQAVEVTCAIARAYQPLRPGALLSFQKAALGGVEMKQLLSNHQRDASMNWFETAADWEAELERTGAPGWRVSTVNDRFEMSNRCIVVPQKVLDTELKNTFAHFNEGRLPRWCWRHPGGSDLLRMAGFQNNIYHENHHVRSLEVLLFGDHRQCVVVELGEEMPLLSDVQLSHSRLRALCLGDVSAPVSIADDKWLSSLEATHWLDHVRSCLKKASEVACLLRGGHTAVILQELEERDWSCVVSSLVQVMWEPRSRTVCGFQSLVQKEWVTAGHRFRSRANYQRDRDKDEAPVFLLFLDCVWQLWAQFPSHFQLTGDYLLALHDSSLLPLFCSFLSDCELERSRHTKHLPQSYTTVNGWREGLSHGPQHSLPDPPLLAVWDWTLQYGPQRRARFSQPVGRPTSPQPQLNGSVSAGSKDCDGTLGSVFLLSRGTFSSPPNLLPWRGANSPSAAGSQTPHRKSHRHVPSPDSVHALERLLRPPCAAAPSGAEFTPQEPLLPLLLGPCVGLWRECYLRGALQPQVQLQPQPMERLASEVRQLGDKLVLATST